MGMTEWLCLYFKDFETPSIWLCIQPSTSKENLGSEKVLFNKSLTKWLPSNGEVARV